MQAIETLRRRTFTGATLALLAVTIAPRAASAQDFPTRPVTLVSPYTPGSGSDLTARAISPFLKDALGQSVVVENKAGAGGTLGSRTVAKAAADGYTLLLGSVSFAVQPALLDVGYDPVDDFDAIGMLGVQQMALLVPASFEARSLADIVTQAKARPGRLNFGSAGAGSIGHLQMELFKSRSGLDIVHIPFAGTPQVMTEIASGRVQMGIVAVPTAAPLIKGGEVRALAVEGDRRAPELPGVPTMEEAGYPELGDGVWYIVLAPKGTPAAVIGKLNEALNRALAMPAAAEALQRAGLVVAGRNAPEEAGRYLEAQVSKWRKVVADARLKLDTPK